MFAILLPRSHAIFVDESSDPMFWQLMAADISSEAERAYIDGDYEYAEKAQCFAACYYDIAHKEYQRWIAARR